MSRYRKAVLGLGRMPVGEEPGTASDRNDLAKAEKIQEMIPSADFMDIIQKIKKDRLKKVSENKFVQNKMVPFQVESHRNETINSLKRTPVRTDAANLYDDINGRPEERAMLDDPYVA